MPVFRCIPKAIVLGQQCQMVLHFLTGAGVNLEAFVNNELQVNFFPILRNLQNNGCAYASLSVQQVTDPVQPAQVFSMLGTNGALSGAIAPSFIAGLFSIRTAMPGRHGHGRFYMFGVHQDSISNGVNIALAAYQGAANNIVTRYKVGGTGPIVLGVCPRANPADFKSVSAIIARSVWGVQRRRNIGVGG